MTDPSSILYICRPEFADTLAEEIQEKSGKNPEFRTPSPGLLLATPADGLANHRFIFERQRLLHPSFVPTPQLKPLPDDAVRAILGRLITETPLWTSHLITLEDDESGGNESAEARKLDGIYHTLIRMGRKISADLEKRFRPPHRLKPGGWVLQLILARDGLWYSLEPLDGMVNPRPGGITRMKWDPLAPSRSYLKIEESIEHLQEPPVAGEKVIDLGAAPGGWTYAFVKRGCDVWSVDHGPMKLPPHQDGWGTVQHLRENGITFQPPADLGRVDWLVADMLIAPGVALGLLKRWLESRRARRIICNIKLPQQQPYQSVQPIEHLLSRQHDYRWEIRQLYHDRREVTVLAKRIMSHEGPPD